MCFVGYLESKRKNLKICEGCFQNSHILSHVITYSLNIAFGNKSKKDHKRI